MGDPATTKETELWTYAGRRAGHSGKLISLWLDPQGEERVFTKTPHQIVGGVYEIDVARDSNGAFTGAYFASLHFTRKLDADENEHLPSWLVEDKAAYEADQHRKFEARVKREDQLASLTLSELREHARETLSPSQRTALVAWLINYIR